MTLKEVMSIISRVQKSGTVGCCLNLAYYTNDEKKEIINYIKANYLLVNKNYEGDLVSFEFLLNI
jgi:hypothetical protein